MTAVQPHSPNCAPSRADLAFDADCAQAFFMDSEFAYLEARTAFIEQTTELLHDLSVVRCAGKHKWPHLLHFEMKWVRLLSYEIGRSAGVVGANRLATLCRELREGSDQDGFDLEQWTHEARQALQHFIGQSEVAFA